MNMSKDPSVGEPSGDIVDDEPSQSSSPPQLAEKDCTPPYMAPSCLLPRTLAPSDAIDADDASGRSVTNHQHKLLPFRPTTSSFISTPRDLHSTHENHKLAGLVAALENENERLRAELELKTNQLDAILHQGGQDPKPNRRVFLPSSPTSTLQDTEDLGCVSVDDVKNILDFNISTDDASSSGDDITTKAVQTLLRNFDSFHLLSKDNENIEEDGDDKADTLIGEDLLSDDDDSCSYSV